MKVAELTEEQLRAIISEVVEEKLKKLLDPDYGLELREDFVSRLEASIASSERISFETVKRKLGLS
jgi:hypothetical protein